MSVWTGCEPGCRGLSMVDQLALRFCYKSPAASGFWHFAGISLAVIVVTSLIVGWLLNSFCPEAAGSGIPQAKLAFWKEFGFAPKRIAWIKFVAGVISIGGGQSLGREGPSVQIGSNLASTLAGLLGVPKQGRRSASAAGSAAGLAAAFNAPLASVAFVLEEIIGDLNSRSLGAVLLASVIGAFIVHAFIGAQPALRCLTSTNHHGARIYSCHLPPDLRRWPVLSFRRALFHCEQRRAAYQFLPRWLHPLAGGIGDMDHRHRDFCL